MQRPNFTFHKEWRDAAQDLPSDIRAEIYEAIIEYALTGMIPAGLKPIANAAFRFVKERIDKDAEKYKALCVRNQNNGAKSKGRPKTQENPKKPKKPSGLSGLSKEEISPAPPKEEVIIDSSLHSESTHTNTAREEFEKWLEHNCPYIHKHYKLPSDTELAKLKETYGSQAIADECLNIENRVDLRKRYSNLYRTLLNWLKNNIHATTPTTQRDYQISQHPTDSELYQQAADLLQRRTAERHARNEALRQRTAVLAEGQP